MAFSSDPDTITNGVDPGFKKLLVMGLAGPTAAYQPGVAPAGPAPSTDPGGPAGGFPGVPAPSPAGPAGSFPGMPGPSDATAAPEDDAVRAYGEAGRRVAQDPNVVGTPPPTGFGGLLSRLAPIVQGVAAAVADATGNRHPEERMLQQHQLAIENAEKQQMLKQANQERQLRMDNLQLELQRKIEIARKQPVLTTEEEKANKLAFMRSVQEQEAEIKSQYEKPSLVPDRNGNMFWAHPPTPDNPTGQLLPALLPPTPVTSEGQLFPGAQGPVQPGLTLPGKQLQEGPKNVKEDIERQLAVAYQAGDQQKVASLQKELRDMDPLAEDRLKSAENRAATAEGHQGDARLDRSYQYNATKLENLRKPVAAVATRFGNLESSLSQNTPQANALVATELLSIMAGGQGSGLRMNEAEIARIVGGRSHWQDLQAAVQKWKTDPAQARSITDEQNKEIKALADTVREKITEKQKIFEGAADALINTDDIKQHRRIIADAEKRSEQIDNGTAVLPSDLSRYFKAAHGDKNKARELAKAEGKEF